MRDLVSAYDRFLQSGEPFGRAVVTSVWGSAPRPAGACLLATTGGRIAGSVSGGCVESATAAEIADAIGRGTSKLVEFGVSDETAWEVGLACGGTIHVFVEPEVRPALVDALRAEGGAVIATVVEGQEPAGASLVVREDGSVDGPLAPAPDGAGGADAAATLAALAEEVRRVALDALHRETSRSERLATADGELVVFLEVHPRQPRLVVFGGVHVAAQLVTLARTLGYRTLVADGRDAFLTRERFPDADELIHGWPDEAFERIGLDASTYVCVLSHDPKFDEPALEIALRSPAAYVGAIGSRTTQAKRRERLRRAGLTGEQIDRLRGPIGLDLGGRQPGEIALAILAEITAVRYGASGRAKSEGR